MDMENKPMSLYQLNSTGKQLEVMFVYGDIDEETMKDTQEFLLSELEQKSNSLVILYKIFDNFVDKEGALNKEIKRLQALKKEYEARFENYKAKLTECMYNIGMTTGKANGIMTDKGVLTLTKSQREIPVDIEKVDDKYKKHKVEFEVNKEELAKLEKVFGDRLKISEPKLDKDLYKKEIGIEKQQHYSVTVK